MLLHKLLYWVCTIPNSQPLSPNSGNCKITESSIHLPPMVLDMATKCNQVAGESEAT